MSYKHPITWQRKQTDLINDEIEVLLASLSDVSSFRDIVREPLSGVRGGIATETTCRKPWYLLPLIVCEAVSGHYEHAIPASAVLQLFMAAGEVFDDIEDADAAGSLSARYSSAIATNAATALLILAERAISRLKGRGVADCVIVHVMDAVNSFELADRLLISWANRASHTFDLVRSEAVELIDACEKAHDCFRCSSCGRWVWFADAEGSEWVQCQCGQLRWRYGKG